jgi:hypothetical protein
MMNAHESPFRKMLQLLARESNVMDQSKPTQQGKCICKRRESFCSTVIQEWNGELIQGPGQCLEMTREVFMPSHPHRPAAVTKGVPPGTADIQQGIIYGMVVYMEQHFLRNMLHSVSFSLHQCCIRKNWCVYDISNHVIAQGDKGLYGFR